MYASVEVLGLLLESFALTTCSLEFNIKMILDVSCAARLRQAVTSRKS